MKENTDNTRNLLVIKASAGSGKTYRLAKEYIKHLLFTRDADSNALLPRRHKGEKRLLNAHRQLLAITFTNKATDEMKERIVKELYKLSLPDVDSDYLADFMTESGISEPELRELALQALNELLFDYSNFNVSTIDSFFQTILRNFARELDRDFNYDIQLEEDYAVRVAVHNFLLSLGKEGKPTQVDQWVKDYQQHLVHGDAEKRKWKFFDDSGELNNFAKQINAELFRSRMDEIRKYLGNIEDGTFHPDFTHIYAFLKLMNAELKKSQDEMDFHLETLWHELGPIRDDLSGSKSFKKWLNKEEITPLSKTLENADEAMIVSQFLKNRQAEPEVIGRLLQQVNNYFNCKNKTAFFKHIVNNLGLLGMLAMIDLFLEEYRHESNSILISDTNDLIGTVLASGTDFVYERVGTTISHFMIDEFQDTSAKQYENFCGLLQESLANRNFNMLIGDAKQSIYRFRNADPTVFREKVGEDFEGYIDDERETTGGEDNEDKPTSTNYRSSRHIIEFNNSLFTFLRDKYAMRPVVVDTYADVKQAMPADIDEDKLPGYVRLLTDNYKELLNDDTIKESLPAGFQVEDGSDIDVLTVLPGYLLKLHERYDWGRIGILVNRNKEGDRVVESILNYNKRTTGEEIRIISGESLLLNNSPVIRRIIAMLRFIDISQYGVGEEDDEDTTIDQDRVRRDIRDKRLSDQRLYTALNNFVKMASAHPDASPSENGEMLVKALNEVQSGAGQDSQDQFVATLAQLLPSAGELTTLVSIVETIIAHFKSTEADADTVDAETIFLLAFQDAVMKFASMRNGGSVREFLKYWDEKKGTLAVSSAANNNSINIMSIHKAKGLEFDCVVIPFADWEIDDNSKETAYWMPREEFLDAMTTMGVEGLDTDTVPPLVYVDKKSIIALNKAGKLGKEASAFVSKVQDDVLIDNLNKTYVVMTRPRTEMHIFSQGSSHTVAPLLREFAVSNMAPMVGASGWFETGIMSTRQEMQALREKKEAKKLAKERTLKEVEPEQLAMTQYVACSIPSDLRVRVEHASSSRIKAGIRLHSLFSGINDRYDVERVISQGIKHGAITSDPNDPCGIDNVKAHVVAPIMEEGSRVAAWFDPANRVYSERTITSASTSLWDEGGIENLRPDRIVRRPDGQFIVIDYKSGDRNDKSHLEQLQGYIAKLRLIFPNAPISGRIWYVTQGIILDEKGKILDLKL